jgi:3-isopropylmalate dehydrogenase
MKNYNISLIKGDGIGVEIVDEAVKVLDAVSKKFDINFEYKEYLMGGCAIDATGNPLPQETIDGVKASDACLFGAIGGPKWDNQPRELRPESGLLRFRKR